MNEKMIRQGAFTSIYAFNGNTSSPLGCSILYHTTRKNEQK